MRARPRVLVVEDEEGIRSAVCQTLHDFGFDAVEAASGTAALSVIQEHPKIDALFTDMRLGPGPDGWDVALAFRAAHPDKPVIYASGYAPGERRRVPHALFFPKPYRAEKVAAALQVLIFPSGDLDLHCGEARPGGHGLVRLSYMSRPTEKASYPDFEHTMAELVDQAQRLNRTHGLTGALIVNPSYFIQVLEGEARPLFATLARITRDLRHDEVRIFDISSVSSRVFGSWAMHCGTGRCVTPELIQACLEGFRHPGPLGARMLIDALLESTREAA